jgi:TRAP-type mannitol/chloroaromatic compound transport system permease small subunit
LRLLLDLAALVLFVSFFALMTWHGLGVMSQSWTSGSRSQSAIETPTVIPQALWIVGLLGFVVVGILLLLHAVTMMVRGDLAGAARAIGTRSAEEEIEDEIRDLKARAEREGRG